MDNKFIREELTKKVRSIDWKTTRLDVRKFLKSENAETLEHWNCEFLKKEDFKI